MEVLFDPLRDGSGETKDFLRVKTGTFITWEIIRPGLVAEHYEALKPIVVNTSRPVF
jgi:hypothetical protein